MTRARALAGKVVLLAWDAADWKIVNPLLDAGQMPHLASLIERGVMGNLASPAPLVPPLLWTTVATGKTADRHGILSACEPDPATGGVRPAAGTSRRGKAVWNILNQSGVRAHVAGWPATHPAEPLAGVMISDAFPKAAAPYGKAWPLAAGSVHPAALAPALEPLRVHAGDLTAEELRPFVPELSRIDQEKDHRLIPLAKALAETVGIHAAATWVMENQPWDFLAVHYGALAQACRSFIHYHPPRLESVPEADFALYRDVVTGVYRFADMMLGRILGLAGPEAAVMLVSAYGFCSDRLRPPVPANGEAHELWHRSPGMLCLAGPGVRHDELVFCAGILDVAPTLLAILGLPAGEDMPGRPLAEAFEQPLATTRIPSWEAVPGPSGMHRLESEEDLREARAGIEELAGLGYVDAIPEGLRKQARAAANSQRFNLARTYVAAGRAREALPLFEAVWRESPEDPGVRVHLAQCCFLAGRLDWCRELLEGLATRPEHAPLAEMLAGMLLLAEGKRAEGLVRLRSAEQMSESLPHLAVSVGRVYLETSLLSDAERAFGSALKADAELGSAHEGLAQVLLETGRTEEAAEAALDAIALDFHQPRAHFTLARALERLGRHERSRQAFEIARSLTGQADGVAKDDRPPAA